MGPGLAWPMEGLSIHGRGGRSRPRLDEGPSPEGRRREKPGGTVRGLRQRWNVCVATARARHAIFDPIVPITMEEIIGAGR